MSFLNAEWRKLAIANYEIDEAILKKFVPAKTELDQWNDTTYVSLVGFRFVNTKVLGIKIPFHTNFEEVNLRFYVRHKDNGEWKRGVVFIKEIVPRAAITFVANNLYYEHYETMQMKHLWQENPNNRVTKYEWKCNNQWQSMRIESELQSSPISTDSETEFITEHYWGYTKVNDSKTYEYEVTHPKWEAYKVNDYQINVDYGLVYGEPFKILNQMTPKSVMLAEGSQISVENKRLI